MFFPAIGSAVWLYLTKCLKTSLVGKRNGTEEKLNLSTTNLANWCWILRSTASCMEKQSALFWMNTTWRLGPAVSEAPDYRGRIWNETKPTNKHLSKCLVLMILCRRGLVVIGPCVAWPLCYRLWVTRSRTNGFCFCTCGRCSTWGYLRPRCLFIGSSFVPLSQTFIGIDCSSNTHFFWWCKAAHLGVNLTTALSINCADGFIGFFFWFSSYCI